MPSKRLSRCPRCHGPTDRLCAECREERPDVVLGPWDNDTFDFSNDFRMLFPMNIIRPDNICIRFAKKHEG